MATSNGTGGKAGSMTWLLGGIVLGVLGTVFLPGLADPYLPDSLRGERQEVTGIVEAKSAEVDRLLLTVGSDAGAMLVTYSKNVAEIDLLVEVGDTVVLEVEEYAPFVDDAKIRRVSKRGDVSPAAEDPPAAAVSEDLEPADSIPSDESVLESEDTDQ
jgi:hypothetical protein